MGFFDSFLKAARGESDDSAQRRRRSLSGEEKWSRTIREINEDEADEDIFEEVNHPGNHGYRKRGLESASSNHGWYTCVKCGRHFRAGDMDIDHILPRSKGGMGTRDNLQCICKHCNRSKQDDMTDTRADLRRRKQELRDQDREDARAMARAERKLKKQNR